MADHPRWGRFTKVVYSDGPIEHVSCYPPNEDYIRKARMVEGTEWTCDCGAVWVVRRAWGAYRLVKEIQDDEDDRRFDEFMSEIEQQESGDR